ncbi:type II toxin-antitoxin system VapC family toxin [Cyanobium gracile]|uniref:Ribonuclease VapC n=1 Tax=Cyanobium gracile (strain ATCC 27147 / PCC 6307) TaxID=292564 RepID=K9P6Y9_CYAGP|nr:type II toxin-antitoxin system VapC family toxin [Cyanobium gracile]AFY28860.1 putative nucleic acid-binding protein, contains PIN domain [Cyanobium gracile PCC 6307]
MIVLDTNVIAELMRPQPEPAVLAWADGLVPAEVGITAMNEAEILHGLIRLPEGRRKQALLDSWQALVTALLGDRVWAFHREAAHWYGELLVRREQLGRPIATADAVIAATALAQGAQLATRNVSDFTDLGLDLINPWTHRRSPTH